MADADLSYAVYLDAIAEEADRFDQAAVGRFVRRVATCPGWTVADLSAHLASVYRRWTAQVIASDPATRAAIDELSLDGEEETISALDAAVGELLDALRDAGPDAPCWNFSGMDLDTRWVARRVAHESAIHRVDVELAWGHPTRIDRELALDGLDERINVILAPRVDEKTKRLGGSLGLVCDDADRAYVIEVVNGELRVQVRRGPADCVVVGSASELFCFSWNRLSPVNLRLTGDPAIAGAWAGLP